MRSQWSSVPGQAVQELSGSRQQDHTIEVRHFPAFDFAIFMVNIRFGQKLANGSSARAAVRHVDHRLRIKAMFNRPSMPHSRNRGSGINEHAVQVKEHGTAADGNHGI